MPKHRTEYPAEFRRQVVELHRPGRSARALAKEFEPSEQTIRNWHATPYSVSSKAGTTPTGGIRRSVTSHRSATKS